MIGATEKLDVVIALIEMEIEVCPTLGAFQQAGKDTALLRNRRLFAADAAARTLTPSASATSFTLLPRIIQTSIRRPCVSGRELRARHRRQNVSLRSNSSCGVGSEGEAEYSIPSLRSREYCALLRVTRRWWAASCSLSARSTSATSSET